MNTSFGKDCHWDLNSKHAVAKVNSRLWFLRRLKLLGASKETMLLIYKLFCRSVLEYCAPVWAGGLTKANIQSIERVQRNAMKIILGSEYNEYEVALENINEESLQKRRDKLSLRFAETCLKNDKFKSWFKVGVSTRNNIVYCYPHSKIRRYRKSAIPYLTKLLNTKNK